MTTARLIVNPSTVSLRRSGPATGDIVLVLGSVVFPAAGWNDFVVVILEAWVSALVRLSRNTSLSERVHFMEGPYAVDITRLESGAFQLCAVERPARRRALVEVSPVSLFEDAAKAADAVLQVCRGKSRDVDRLREALASLREEKQRLNK